MRSSRIRPVLLPSLLVAAAVVAGCGSSSHSSGSRGSAAAATGGGSSTTGSTAGAGRVAATGPGPGGEPVVLTTKQANGLGTVLAAGRKKLTVYLFEADNGGSSACTGACAAAWPPVTGKASVAGAAKASDLGTVTRPDGTRQVTYHGHPLYFFIKDKDGGDAYGEGVDAFGAEWYALAPNGRKVDRS